MVPRHDPRPDSHGSREAAVWPHGDAAERCCRGQARDQTRPPRPCRRGSSDRRVEVDRDTSTRPEAGSGSAHVALRIDGEHPAGSEFHRLTLGVKALHAHRPSLARSGKAVIGGIGLQYLV